MKRVCPGRMSDRHSPRVSEAASWTPEPPCRRLGSPVRGAGVADGQDSGIPVGPAFFRSGSDRCRISRSQSAGSEPSFVVRSTTT